MTGGMSCGRMHPVNEPYEDVVTTFPPEKSPEGGLSRRCRNEAINKNILGLSNNHMAN